MQLKITKVLFQWLEPDENFIDSFFKGVYETDRKQKSDVSGYCRK